ncbi:phosphatidylinositol-3-phosphatase ymr1 [Sorochytrium milnesiophthora]
MEHIKISTVRNVLLLRGSKAFLGSLHITPHHLIFKFADASEREIWVFFSTIHELTKKPPNAQLQTTLDISCRNFLFMRLLIQNEDEANAVYETMVKLTHTSAPDQLYAFLYYPSVHYDADGWSVADIGRDYKRMGVPNAAWRETELNAHHALCPTYPQRVIVPSRISDAVLGYAAKFRSKGRLPALVYLHQANGASITRCSQPLVGLKQNRSLQDEKVVEAIFSIPTSSSPLLSSPTSPPSTATVVAAAVDVNAGNPAVTVGNLLIDARPMANAMANTAKGAGTENMEYYKNCRKVYLGIDNIHVMRDSLAKLAEAIQQCDMDGTPLSTQILGRSGWLKHINILLEGTAAIVNTVAAGAHVLVHCSDGWDRTSQLTALAKLCLDPYYRTVRGFEVLLEMDWIAFGHKFSDRCGHISTDWSATTSTSAAGAALEKVQNRISRQAELREVSPVFHQFLDCVYQLWSQNPTRFEFNEHFLIQVHFHAYSCQFGTFLFNSDLERQKHRLRETTHSLWSYINANAHLYKNAQYDAQADAATNGGVVDSRLKYLRYWSGLFKQTEEDNSNLMVAADEIGATTAAVMPAADGEEPHNGHGGGAGAAAGDMAAASLTAASANIVGKLGNLWNRFGLGSNSTTSSSTNGGGGGPGSTAGSLSSITSAHSLSSTFANNTGTPSGFTSAQGSVASKAYPDGQPMHTISKGATTDKTTTHPSLADMFTPPTSLASLAANPAPATTTTPSTAQEPHYSYSTSGALAASPVSGAPRAPSPEVARQEPPPETAAEPSGNGTLDPLGLGASISVMETSQRGVLAGKSS